ncbi:MAG: hypothetical protein ACRDFX_12400, partial [Chloroflexota bacterium]
MDAKWFRNSFIWLILMVFVLAIAFQIFRTQSPPTKSIALTGSSPSIVSILHSDINNHKSVTLTQDGTTVTLDDGHRYQATVSDQLDITQFLANVGLNTKSQPFVRYVDIHYATPSQFGNLLGDAFTFLPLLLFGVIIFFFMRQAQGSNNQAMSFGKSRARMFVGNRPTITFADVAGV